jgi:hypothetical protein
MKMKRIWIDNLASFIDFDSKAIFEKSNLIFGSNGSGKSTLVSLLQYLQYAKSDEQSLRNYLKQHVSRETNKDNISIKIEFEDKVLTLEYNTRTDLLILTNSELFPIRVFNEEYTLRNIGDVVDIELPNSGIVIGEKNRDLENAEKERDAFENQIKNRNSDAELLLEKAIIDFKEKTSSNQNVDEIICIDNLMADTCEFEENDQLIEDRKKLGFGKPEKILTRIDERQFQFKLKHNEIEVVLKEIVETPIIEERMATLLKKYTSFYMDGLTIWNDEKNSKCPFCRREWVDSTESITRFKTFLQSEYTTKRKYVNDIISEIEEYRKKIIAQTEYVNGLIDVVKTEGEKYSVDVTKWQVISYNDLLHSKVTTILKKKYENMNIGLTIKAELDQLESYHLSIIRGNNLIIDTINNSIDSITANRKKLNNAIAQHTMKKEWIRFTATRDIMKQLDLKLEEVNTRIDVLEESIEPQDTNQIVVNELLKFIGLSEYYIDSNNKLSLRIDKGYDISKEGRRISTAQRKIISMCYYFAEIISSTQDIKDLKNYILIFDDPVDSADYIYFHSIAAVIEKCENIIGKILNSKNLKFGQVFVFTHNSVLYDRLNCRWAKEYHKALEKEGNVSVLNDASPQINNYVIYIKEVISFINKKNPDKRRMLFIGNVIRRVLEILASFDNLGSNDFQEILDGMGKNKLALLANHLSHESFSKVLNPFSSSDELKDACKELLEVIHERHPYQYDKIIEKFKIET